MQKKLWPHESHMIWYLNIITFIGHDNQELYRYFINKSLADSENLKKFEEFIFANLKYRNPVIDLLGYIFLDPALKAYSEIFINGGVLKILSNELVECVQFQDE